MSVTVTLTYRQGDVDQKLSATKAGYEAARDAVLEQRPAAATALSLLGRAIPAEDSVTRTGVSPRRPSV